MQQETKEFLWSARLSGEEKVIKWRGREDGALEQIVLKLAVLGSGAKEGERNLVEVTSFNSDQEKIKACICALTAGRNENQHLADLSLFPPVNLTLCEGSGPVEIVGNHIVLDEDFSDDDDDDEEGDEELDEEMVSDLREKLLKKNAAKGDAPQSVSKLGRKKKDEDEDFEEIDDEYEDMDDDDDDDEDDIDDDDDDEVELPGKKRPKTAGKNQEPEEEEEEDDEEEEVKEAPTKKRKLTNGKSDKKPNMTSPERATKPKPEQKTPKAQKNGDTPKTPKSEKKTPAKVQYKSVDEIKTVIQKYPGGKPRKEDKFCNWVRNNFKVDNQSWVDQLWKWHKKEMGL